MSTQALTRSIPTIDIHGAVHTAQGAVNTAQRRVTLQGRRTAIHGKHFLLGLGWVAFASIMTSLIPDDAYDWEDDSMAELLDENYGNLTV